VLVALTTLAALATLATLATLGGLVEGAGLLCPLPRRWPQFGRGSCRTG
jgi:hypothetical protein